MAGFRHLVPLCIGHVVVVVVLLAMLSLLAIFCLQFLALSLAFGGADHRSVGFSMLVFRRPRRYRPRGLAKSRSVGWSVGPLVKEDQR